MTARTHDTFALASLVTVAAYFPPNSLNLLTFFSAIIAVNIGALLPDMDQAGNRMWDLLPAGDYFGKFFRKIFYKHRTVTHSLIGVILIYKTMEWLLPRLLNSIQIDGQIVLISIMIGYVSHLLADSFTEEGLPLLFPLPLTFGIPPVKKLRIVTDSWQETYLVQPGIILYLIWFFSNHQQQLLQILRSTTTNS
jgi:inner membrane protein